MAASPRSRTAWVLAQLVRLYPRGFRQRFRHDYERAVHGLADEPRHQGVHGRLRLVRLLLVDTAHAAPAEWQHVARTPAVALPRRSRPRRTGDRMDTLWQDIKYAFRSLRRTPGFALVVIISLALGIGANTLVYSVLDGLVLRPFAYPEPERLVAIGATFPKISSAGSSSRRSPRRSTSTCKRVPAPSSASPRSTSGTARSQVAIVPSGCSPRSCGTTRRPRSDSLPRSVVAFAMRRRRHRAARSRCSAIGCGSRALAAIPAWSGRRFASMAYR